MSLSAKLRVILPDDNIRKMVLSSGIQGTILELKSMVQEAFDLQEDFNLQYQDSEFDNQFFTLMSTDEISDKDTIKVVCSSTLSHETASCSSNQIEGNQEPPDDSCSFSSSNTDVFPTPKSDLQRSQPWPENFTIPSFKYDTELALEHGNEAYRKEGTLLNSPSIKTDILEKLAESIFQYVAYPSNVQICAVAEALIAKHPCLKEPGSHSGYYGWQTSLKYKMANYRTKLRSLGCPELMVNSVKKKQLQEKSSSRNIKKPKKAEVNYLPPYPLGETKQSLEKERKELLTEVKKKDNHSVISQKMAKTFSLRRQEILNEFPRIEDFKSRWPALFNATQISEEFLRITTIHLVEKFMSSLDKFTPRLISIFRKKGGAVRKEIQMMLDVLLGESTIHKRREIVLRCLMKYLGENVEDLLKEYVDVEADSIQSDWSQYALKVFIIKHEGAPDAEPADIGVVVEGIEAVNNLGNFAKACAILLGVIYSLNLSYPKELRYTFEVFQKLFLELDGLKLSSKVFSVKNRLMC